MPVLNTLQISHNKLATFEDIAQLADCDELKVLDLSYNYLDDPNVVEVCSYICVRELIFEKIYYIGINRV